MSDGARRFLIDVRDGFKPVWPADRKIAGHTWRFYSAHGLNKAKAQDTAYWLRDNDSRARVLWDRTRQHWCVYVRTD